MTPVKLGTEEWRLEMTTAILNCTTRWRADDLLDLFDFKATAAIAERDAVIEELREMMRMLAPEISYDDISPDGAGRVIVAWFGSHGAVGITQAEVDRFTPVLAALA